MAKTNEQQTINADKITVQQLAMWQYITRGITINKMATKKQSRKR